MLGESTFRERNVLGRTADACAANVRIGEFEEECHPFLFSFVPLRASWEIVATPRELFTSCEEEEAAAPTTIKLSEETSGEGRG